MGIPGPTTVPNSSWILHPSCDLCSCPSWLLVWACHHRHPLLRPRSGCAVSQNADKSSKSAGWALPKVVVSETWIPSAFGGLLPGLASDPSWLGGTFSHLGPQEGLVLGAGPSTHPVPSPAPLPTKSARLPNQESPACGPPRAEGPLSLNACFQQVPST